MITRVGQIFCFRLELDIMFSNQFWVDVVKYFYDFLQNKNPRKFESYFINWFYLMLHLLWILPANLRFPSQRIAEMTDRIPSMIWGGICTTSKASLRVSIFWEILDNFGTFVQFWTKLCKFRQFCANLYNFVQFWTILDNFVQFMGIYRFDSRL